MGERVAASRSPSRMGVNSDPPDGSSDSSSLARSHSLPASHSTDVPLDTPTDLPIPVKEHSEAANRDTARLEARVFELENRLRETEEELEFYFNFFKKTRRAGNAASGSKGVASGSSGRLRRSLGNGAEQETGLRGRLGEQSMSSRWSFGAKDIASDTDSDLEDDEAPVNVNYTEPWSKTLGRNAALEYTRDSPMFRKRLWAFQETLKPLQGHVGKLLARVKAYCTAGETFRREGVALAEELSSKEASRLMFSNNLAGMGDLAANISKFSMAFKQIHELISLLADSMTSGLAVPLESFRVDFKDLDALSDELDERGREYEGRLSKALDQKVLPREGPLHDRAARSRWEFELYRFDLVRYLNQLDAKKVLLLESGINNAFYALLAFFQGGSEILGSQEKAMRRRQALLGSLHKRFAGDGALWSYVRSRLEAELQGALPPPGAPPGARAPINPRASCPVYVAELTTEVLSAESLEASPTDLVHFKDEGVLKQGYLFKRFTLGRKERCWYRLHSSRLYTLELGRAARGDGPVCVFDLRKGAVVAPRPGKVPFCFLLVSDDGFRLELQAENEDEMQKWMAAIRRCRRLELVEGSGNENAGSDGNPREVPADVVGGWGWGSRTGLKTNGLQAESLMNQIMENNSQCAECGSSAIEWVSINIGITLCSACATVHRTLGNAVSTLRSLKLDQWSVFVLQALAEDLGNKKATQVWECNIPPGWTKPKKDSGPQDREQWIIAKYRWFGFVGEDSRDPSAVSRAMFHAAARGDVDRICWCIAHRGDVNWSDPSTNGRTPLHAACEADRRQATVILLLNGANTSLKDDNGVNAHDMVSQDPYADLSRLLAEVERGELW